MNKESKTKEIFLSPISAQDVFRSVKTSSGPVIYLGDQLIQDNELWNLSSECDQIVNMRIWNVFQETLKNQAEELIFCHPGTPDELDKLHSGKWMLYNLKEQVAIVNLIRAAAMQRLPKKRPGGIGVAK